MGVVFPGKAHSSKYLNRVFSCLYSSIKAQGRS